MMAMNSAPLGIFDSGVGGLTVVEAVRGLLPREDVIYLGDTARVPYGSKSPETIRRFALEDARYLTEKGVKAIVVACNTATAHGLEYLRGELEVPIIGVIEPGVDAVIADPAAERIGIIATRGTIRSHAYQHALAQRRTGLVIQAQETPLLVPIVEEDWMTHQAARLILSSYLTPMLNKGIDTLLLACTHYPLLMPVLRDLLPDDLRLVDSASTCARFLKEELERLDLLKQSDCDGVLTLHLTDLSEEFEALASRFLSKPPGRVRRAVLEA